MISFLSRTMDFFFFFLSLWIYLWLAETSQQPISQTTWLRVTRHCNHVTMLPTEPGKTAHRPNNMSLPLCGKPLVNPLLDNYSEGDIKGLVFHITHFIRAAVGLFVWFLLGPIG